MSHPILSTGLTRLLLLLCAVALLACSNQAATSDPAVSEQPTESLELAEPSATLAPDTPVPGSSPFADIEQGVTPEGYQVLGAADARLSYTMYSDFL